MSRKGMNRVVWSEPPRSPTCENVLDATGNFPRIEECRFNEHEVRMTMMSYRKKQRKDLSEA